MYGAILIPIINVIIFNIINAIVMNKTKIKIGFITISDRDCSNVWLSTLIGIDSINVSVIVLAFALKT
jgi:hypothetical protein